MSLRIYYPLRLMKKFLFALILISSWIGSVFGFNDVSPNAQYYPALESLLKQNILTDGSFFRPDSGVPAKMYWETLLRSAKVDTGYLGEVKLPPEISPQDPAVPYLRYAVSQGFIDGDLFDPMAEMPKEEALKSFLKFHNIDIRIRSSKKFNNLYATILADAGFFPGIYKYVETAMEANILTDSDVKFFAKPFTRTDLIQWVYRFQTNGEQPANARSNQKERLEQSKKSIPEYKVEFPYQSRKKSAPANSSSSNSKPKISIEILSNDGNYGVKNNDPSAKAESLLRRVLNDLMSNYRFNEELTEAKQEEMVQSAVAGFLKPLADKDKYTRYVVPDQVDEFNESLEGEYQGIGAFVSIVDNHFVIEAPIENSPAEKAGLHPGDIVMAVNGESIVGEELNTSIRKIKGPAGSTVQLTIKRGNETKVLPVVRGSIKLESVTFETKNSVPILKIHKFETDTLPKFLDLINNGTLTGEERGLVIDLRNNPGGRLQEALKISQEFVKKGVTVMQYDPRDSNQKLIADKDGRLADIPKIAILQNKGSASAAEILAVMLVEQREAKIFGQTSVGKGTVQTIKPYGAALLKMTTARWLSPNGNWIHEKGIPADYEFENQTYPERQAGIDSARDAAINYILGR